MKNPVLIIIGGLLLIMFILQVVMFFKIRETLDQRFAAEKILNLSSLQGSNTWIANNDNWDPYQELLQMRNRMEQIFNESIARFRKKTNPTPLTQLAVLDFKNEADRYIVTLDVPGTDMSAIDVSLEGRELDIAIKLEEESSDHSALSEEFKAELHRRLILPGEVNQEQIRSQYNKGILTIILPKKTGQHR